MPDYTVIRHPAKNRIRPNPSKNWYIARVYYSMLVRVETPEDVWTLLDETVEGVDEEVDVVVGQGPLGRDALPTGWVLPALPSELVKRLKTFSQCFGASAQGSARGL